MHEIVRALFFGLRRKKWSSDNLTNQLTRESVNLSLVFLTALTVNRASFNSVLKMHHLHVCEFGMRVAFSSVRGNGHVEDFHHRDP